MVFVSSLNPGAVVRSFRIAQVILTPGGGRGHSCGCGCPVLWQPVGKRRADVCSERVQSQCHGQRDILFGDSNVPAWRNPNQNQSSKRGAVFPEGLGPAREGWPGSVQKQSKCPHTLCRGGASVSTVPHAVPHSISRTRQGLRTESTIQPRVLSRWTCLLRLPLSLFDSCRHTPR